MSVLAKLADNENPESLANRFRRARFELFRTFAEDLPVADSLGRLSILDIGGTESFWTQMGLGDAEDVTIELVNILPIETRCQNIKSFVGDGCDLSAHADKSIDLVFSNSVIEHVPQFADQKRMAREIERVGRHYFVQTPNYYFPIEPHFLFFGFQFLPRSLQVCLVQNFKLGWTERMQDASDAEALVDSVRLLKAEEFRELFPNAEIKQEKVCGLTKSLIAMYRSDDEFGGRYRA